VSMRNYWGEDHPMDEQQKIDRDFDHEATKDRARWIVIALLFLAVVLAFCGTIAHAQSIQAPTRSSSYDWACLDASGAVVSSHQRFDTAFVACYNNPAGDRIQGGTYKLPARGTTTPPPPVCPPKPADESQPGGCPAGTTGTWTQARSYTQSAAPACVNTAGAWTPTAPPSGACVAVPPPPPPTPSAPVNLAAMVTANQTTPANSNVTLTWSAVAGAAECEVWRCTGATCTNFAFVTGADVACATAATYTNTNLPPNLTYRYRVRAWKPASGPYSEILNVTTTPGSTPPPPPTVGAATIDWVHEGANVEGFRILYGASESALVSTVSVPDAAARSFKVDNLPAGTWFFAVRAYNSNAESDNSNVASKVIAP
jgi:hypothetical protein